MARHRSTTPAVLHHPSLTTAKQLITTVAALLALTASSSRLVLAWMPDGPARLTHDLGQTATIKFAASVVSAAGGGRGGPEHFTVLSLDGGTVLLGGRNALYNLSSSEFVERRGARIEWASTDAHAQLCQLKGKTDDDCQNYIRVYGRLPTGGVRLCGTNSYKPLCRTYGLQNGKYVYEKEHDGIGICPYDPEHNSTAVFAADSQQLFSATVADFSGGDPLIYREPQRTEISDLKQLNAPNFVNSIPYGDYIFFFYRETAVEFMNCGKIIYSRVARVCKNDQGGPHQFRNRWTSFLKARLNCSVPGEYPFYFDEIQSTTNIINGKYGANFSSEVIYGTLTTPTNAIGGSAICAYSVRDILEAFEGSFKQQEGINANWLPVPKEKVPNPRPGHCKTDSRLLPENNVNFVKTHSLMESAVQALFGRPLLIRVSLQYRFTAIAVDAQVPALDGRFYDVLYVGTDDGRVLKVVNIAHDVPPPAGKATSATKSAGSSRESAGDDDDDDNSSATPEPPQLEPQIAAHGVVVAESAILPNGAAVKELAVAPGGGYGRVIVVGRHEARLATLNHCHNLHACSDCVALQDPHCAWDLDARACISVDRAPRKADLVQNVLRGNDPKCKTYSDKRISPKFVPNRQPNEVLNVIDGSSYHSPASSSAEQDGEQLLGGGSPQTAGGRHRTTGDGSAQPPAQPSLMPAVTIDGIDPSVLLQNVLDPNGSVLGGSGGVDCVGDLGDNTIDCDEPAAPAAVPRQLVIYTADTLKWFVICSSVFTLFIGFTTGFLISRRLSAGGGITGPGNVPGGGLGGVSAGSGAYPAPFIEQHNQLDRLSSPSVFIPVRTNKVVNVTQNSSPPPKKDNNLDASKDLNIASDGTLQKIKKTYI